MQVKVERSGWRDLGLNDRHRQWGWDCPAVDIDLLFLEYNHGKAVALVEYKNEHAQPQDLTTPTYRALIDLGNRATIPVFIVRYADDYSWFYVCALNKIAKNELPERTRMSEIQWVGFLYALRGTKPPVSLIDALGKLAHFTIDNT